MIKKTCLAFAPMLLASCFLLVIYSLSLRAGMETVNSAFLFATPIFCGAILLYFRGKNQYRSFWKSILWLLGVGIGAVVLSFITGIEGLLCITMAIIPIISGLLVGGVIVLSFQRFFKSRKNTLQVAAFPLLVLAFGPFSQPDVKTYLIEDQIMINADISHVFKLIQDVPDITAEEVPTRFTHLLGIPKPTKAEWIESNAQIERHSYWTRDVHFVERITQIEENSRIRWDFEFPEGWIKDGIQDEHITVGGKYFDVISGGYTLHDIDGQTELTLFTTTRDSSHLGAYAEFWHRFFFTDFHVAILEVIKNRAEKPVT